MKKRRIMLDGCLAGTELNGDIQIKDSEVNSVRKILIDAGAEEQDGGLSLTVTHKSNMVVALRTHYHNKNKFFLNISGNPLTFLTGTNVYGYAEASRIIVDAYTIALETLKVPQRIMEAIDDMDINIHSLEFATYTCEVPDKQQLLNDWYHIYSTAYSSKNGLSHETLCDMLDLKVTRVHKDFKSSVCLRILCSDGREDEAMLEIYDKAKEIRDKTDLMVPKDIEERLRLDLNLNQGWFRRRHVGRHKIKTLKDLCDYVKTKHGSWPCFLHAEFAWALNRTKLFEMWSFNIEAALDSDDRIAHALLKARALMRNKDDQWNAMIKDGSSLDINLDPHPEELYLDMRTV